LLVARNVAEEEERHDRVERPFGDDQLARVGVDEARFRHVVARELDLHRRNVDTCDAVPARELARDRNTAAAAELEHVRVVGESRVEVTHPVQRR
jgi:hypothetical protein